MKWWSYCLLLFLPQTSLSGDHKPLCQKAKEAELIVEMHYQVKGKYPAEYRQKEWAPPYEEQMKTAKTGRITQVFKGNLKKGDVLENYPFVYSRPLGTVQDWDNFFQRKEFRVVYFLKKVGDRYETTGWAEEGAGCRLNPQYSWCPEYDSYKQRVTSCMNQ